MVRFLLLRFRLGIGGTDTNRVSLQIKTDNCTHKHTYIINTILLTLYHSDMLFEIVILVHVKEQDRIDD